MLQEHITGLPVFFSAGLYPLPCGAILTNPKKQYEEKTLKWGQILVNKILQGYYIYSQNKLHI